MAHLFRHVRCADCRGTGNQDDPHGDDLIICRNCQGKGEVLTQSGEADAMKRQPQKKQKMTYTAHQLLSSALEYITGTAGEGILTKDIRDWLVSSAMGLQDDSLLKKIWNELKGYDAKYEIIYMLTKSQLSRLFELTNDEDLKDLGLIT